MYKYIIENIYNNYNKYFKFKYNTLTFKYEEYK